jgi:hypothetical protein
LGEWSLDISAVGRKIKSKSRQIWTPRNQQSGKIHRILTKSPAAKGMDHGLISCSQSFCRSIVSDPSFAIIETWSKNCCDSDPAH